VSNGDGKPVPLAVGGRGMVAFVTARGKRDLITGVGGG